ncbi:MAG: septum formation inhibitor Maf [Campylobacterales bacterium]
MILLGSSSPTRAQILKDAGIAFVQKGSAFDEESLQEQDPIRFVYQATKGKFESVVRLYGTALPILCADTVVVANKRILRKAKTIEEARATLLEQSGNRVSIVTCLYYQDHRHTFIDLSATHYDFAPFDRDALEEYLQTREWEGKAGACMVEGFCKSYIRQVIGLESTAMGLQIEKVRPFLDDTALHA